MQNKTVQKTLSVFMSLVMALSLFPTTVFAAPPSEGIGGIGIEPATINTGYAAYVPTEDDDADALAAKVVHFNGNDWYIIKNESESATSGTLTLLSKECVGASAFDSSGSSNTYSGSTVETYVNNWYTNNISTDAKTAVNGNGAFLLTTEQANAITNTDVRNCSQATEASYNCWWLCSPGSDAYASCVDGDNGNVYDGGGAVGIELGVRPALQLDLSKVEFNAENSTFTLKQASTVEVTSVTLDQNSVTMDIGDIVALTATIEPSNATDKTVKWYVEGTHNIEVYADEDCENPVGLDTATDVLTVYIKCIATNIDDGCAVGVESDENFEISDECNITFESDDQTEYQIVAAPAPYGEVSVKVNDNPAYSAKAGEEVYVSITPNSGYEMGRFYAQPSLDDSGEATANLTKEQVFELFESMVSDGYFYFDGINYGEHSIYIGYSTEDSAICLYDGASENPLVTSWAETTSEFNAENDDVGYYELTNANSDNIKVLVRDNKIVSILFSASYGSNKLYRYETTYTLERPLIELTQTEEPNWYKFTMLSSNVEVHANFRPIGFIIDANGGQIVDGNTVVGETIRLDVALVQMYWSNMSDMLVKEGYTLVGLYEKDEEGNLKSEPFDISTVTYENPLTETKTLYAKWEENGPQQYDITPVDVFNGAVTTTVSGSVVTSAEAGSTVTITATPDSGYVFVDGSIKVVASESPSFATQNPVLMTFDEVAGELKANYIENFEGHGNYAQFWVKKPDGTMLAGAMFNVLDSNTFSKDSAFDDMLLDDGLSTLDEDSLNSKNWIVQQAESEANAVVLVDASCFFVDVEQDEFDSTKFTFTMPKFDVTVLAEFEATSHQISYNNETGVETITIAGNDSAVVGDDVTVTISYSDDRTHFDHADVLMKGVQDGDIAVGDTLYDFSYASITARGNLVFKNPNGEANQGLAVTNGDGTSYAWQDVNHRFSPELYTWKCTEFDENEGTYTFTPFARTAVELKSSNTNDEDVTTVVFVMPDAEVDVFVYSIVDNYSKVYFTSDCDVEYDVANRTEFKEGNTVEIHLTFGKNDKYESVEVKLEGETAPIYPNDETIYSLRCIESTFAESEREGWTVVFVSAEDTSNVLAEYIYNRDEYSYDQTFFDGDFLPSQYVWKCESMDMAAKKMYFSTVDKTVADVVIDSTNPKNVTVSFPMPETDVRVSISGQIDFTEVSSWGQLQEKISAGINARLVNDITATSDDTALTLPEDTVVTIDLNGHVLNRAKEEASSDGSVFNINSGEKSVYLAICNMAEEDIEHFFYRDENSGFHFVDSDSNPEYLAASDRGSIMGAIVTGGNTTGNGGAFNLSGRGALVLNNVFVLDNKATGKGGAVYVDGADVDNESYFTGMDVTLMDATITGNTAGEIGGIYFVGGENKNNELNLMDDTVVIANTNGNVYLPNGMDAGYDSLNEHAVVGFTMETPGNIMYVREADEFFTEAERLTDIRAKIASDDHDYYVDIVDDTATLVKYVTVTFNANGGTGEMTAQKLMKSTATALTSNSFSRSGYTFSGWNTAANGSGTSYTNAQSVSLADDITLYAQWTRNVTPPSSDDSSSSSSSGGSSSSSSTTTITVPVSSDSASVNVSASVSGTTATVKAPTTAELDKIISSTTHTGEVEINVSGLGKEIKTATIPTETVKAVEKAANDTTNDATGLTVTLTEGSVTFDAPALTAISEQAKGSIIQLNLDGISESKMTAAQRETARNMQVQAVYDAYLSSNGVRISDFGDGTATVSIPYTLKDGQYRNGIEVWYIANNGLKTKMPSTFDGAKVSFTTSHFSNYVIAYNEELANAVDAVDVFNDVNATDWFADSVRWAYRNDVMNGVSQHTFSPNNDTSRAMVATMLWRMEGSPVATSSMAFTDVADGAWFTEAVRWASANGIITGYTKNGEKVFNPDGAVTREQLATMLYRYAQYKNMDVSVGEDTNILSYNDATSVSEYAMPAIQWACGAGIINGASDPNGGRNLAPQQASSRAVVATMFMRFAESKK